MIIDVIEVKLPNDYQLNLLFENGSRRIFNMKSYIDEAPWVRLNSLSLFKSAYIQNGTVAWTDNIDIDPETLFELSNPIEKD